MYTESQSNRKTSSCYPVNATEMGGTGKELYTGTQTHFLIGDASYSFGLCAFDINKQF